MKRHVEKYELIALTRPEEIQAWLKDKSINYTSEAAFTLLRTNFDKSMTDSYLKNDLINSLDTCKVLMIDRENRNLVGMVVYKEHLEN